MSLGNPSTQLIHDLSTHDVHRPKDISISSVDCFIDGEIGLSVGGSWPGDHVQIPLDAEKIPRASTSHTVSTLV